MTSDLALNLHKIHCGYWTGLHMYPGIWLSDAGIVASTRGRKLRVLKNTRRGRYLSLSVERGPYIHALMCETFYGPRPAGAEVRHLDGNRDNNHISNLRWGTTAENAADTVRHGTLSGEHNGNAKLTAAIVAEMRTLRAATGLSHKKIAERFGVSTMTAYRAVEKQSWK